MSEPVQVVVPAKRSQAQRRDASERRLIEATMLVVATRGVTAATFEAIGQQAGFSRGLATQRFGSKHGLIDAVIGYLHRRREAILAAERSGERPGIEAIASFADRHLRRLSDDYGLRAYFMLLASSVADGAGREAFAASNDRVRTWLEAEIRRGQADRSIRPDLDPHASAVMVGSLIQGICLQWLVDPTTDLVPIRTSTVATLRRSLSNGA